MHTYLKRKPLKCVLTGRPVLTSAMNTSLLLLPDTDRVDKFLLLVNDDHVVQLKYHHVFDKKGKKCKHTDIIILILGY